MRNIQLQMATIEDRPNGASSSVYITYRVLGWKVTIPQVTCVVPLDSTSLASVEAFFAVGVATLRVVGGSITSPWFE